MWLVDGNALFHAQPCAPTPITPHLCSLWPEGQRSHAAAWQHQCDMHDPLKHVPTLPPLLLRFLQAATQE